MRLNNCNSLLSLSLAYFILIDQMELVDYVAESLKHYDNMFTFTHRLYKSDLRGLHVAPYLFC